MRLGILGPLLVADDAGAEIRLAAARQRVLLAVLLARANQMVTVAELAEIVWDGAPPGGAARTVRSYVMRLRQAVGPAMAARIRTRDPGYLCQVDEGELDLLRFEALFGQADAALRAGAWAGVADAARAALHLWRGEPLLDVPSQLLRDGLVPRLEQLRLRLIEDRVEADLRLHDDGRLVPELTELVAAYPLRERFRAQLMLALARAGRRGEALQAYHDARRTLVEELGMGPGPELRDLQQRILADSAPLGVLDSAKARLRLRSPGPIPAPAAADVPRQLPPAVAHFTGRADEMALLSELAGRVGQGGGAVVISAIGGTPGIGKTALALHWAHRAAARFPDGQLYVNLRGYDPCGTPLPAAAVVRRFLDALAVAGSPIPADPDGQLSLYRSLVAGKRMLIVLDNARDAEQVRPLLPGSSASLVLVTSRDRLAGLVAVDGAAPVVLAPLHPAEAYELLSRRLGAGRTGRESGAVSELADLCARLPLALNIAAARAIAHPTEPLAALVDEVRDAQQRLDVLSTRDSAADIRAVFSWSYRTLPPPAARMFRLLGICAGPDVSVPAASSLAGLPTRRAARPVLDELAAAHLLTEHAPGRYAYHDLLRAYAAEQARRYDTPDARHAALRRVLDHHLHTARAATLRLFPARDPVTPPPPQAGTHPEDFDADRPALAWLDAERPALVAAAALAAREGFDTHAWQIPATLAPYLDRSGHWQEYVAVQATALAAAERAGDPAAQANAHCLLGRAHSRTGAHEDAGAHLRRALELYGTLDDPAGQAHTHHSLGWLAGRQDRYADALRHAHHALDLYRAAGHRTGQARALNTVGWYRSLLGRHDEAMPYCRQALDLHRELGNHDGEADAWDSLGHAHRHLGHTDQALDCYQHALDLFRKLGDRYQQADVLGSLGAIHRETGDLTAAAEALRQAIAILDDLRHPHAAKLRSQLSALH